jgi:hypothetical protein
MQAYSLFPIKKSILLTLMFYEIAEAPREQLVLQKIKA